MSQKQELEIQKFAQELTQNPNSRVFALLADVYRQQGDYEKAISIAQEGLKHHPHYFGGQIALARAFFENGDLDLSRKIFESILRFSPDHVLAHRILAHIYILQKEELQAIPLLRKLLALDPDDVQTREQLQELEKEGSEKSPTKTATLANLYRSQGHVQEALEIYEELKAVEPKNVLLERSIQELQGQIRGLPKKERLEKWLAQIQERRREI